MTAPRRVPAAAKACGLAFLAVFVPVYLRTYGPSNFLWFCDAALLLTVAGMCVESPLLVSMSSVGILIPQCFWILDLCGTLFHVRLLGLTAYMFDSRLPLSIRGLSLFHGWLPALLLWLLSRLGYDKRALSAWTGLAAGLLLACYFFAPPPGTRLADPDIPVNLNYVFGLMDQRPQGWVDPRLYAVLWLGALWLGAFLPTHLALRRIFPAARRDA